MMGEPPRAEPTITGRHWLLAVLGVLIGLAWIALIEAYYVRGGNRGLVSYDVVLIVTQYLMAWVPAWGVAWAFVVREPWTPTAITLLMYFGQLPLFIAVFAIDQRMGLGEAAQTAVAIANQSLTIGYVVRGVALGAAAFVSVALMRRRLGDAKAPLIVGALFGAASVAVEVFDVLSIDGGVFPDHPVRLFIVRFAAAVLLCLLSWSIVHRWKLTRA